MFLRKAATFQLHVLRAKIKKKNLQTCVPGSIFFFSRASVSDENRCIACNSTRPALRTPLEKCLRVYCINLKVAITRQHLSTTGNDVLNVNCFRVYQLLMWS